ncbi:Regulation of nuclear pre-mRNA domain-containing protein 2 [Dufourea novaeangliae]|uniref:Regulation of nuclear pre-mRNA domain-containing protein 2 n=1 Tax=Dufourea novaeangliae TaxID=178035 RepID=A0A154NZ79_DUFNO|nr:Regulation of nuclear pre-mRNA domain-containing protein 2 [Dufourea novaeangliae]
MANSDFDVDLFERRLHTLKDSQESIQSLSAWCLERRQHHKKIVATWLQVLKKVKVEHRLTLFYLANDVIQYSKRKNFEFVESWGTTLQRATTMVRDEKVKHRILRIFKIWDQRQVYDEEFLADLSGLISAAPKKKLEPQQSAAPEEFQAALLISTMRSCATLEQATDARLRDLRESNVDVENAEELCASLKDRRRVEDAEKEVDSAVVNVENYVRALEAEIRERTQVLELLEQADQFYETQRGEVKIVTNAYRNFGSRVKNLKKKLDELLPTLVSPIPSPDINAPSPSPDSDIDLPGDENQPQHQLGMIDVAPPSMYGSYSHDYDPVPVPAPEMGQGNDSGDFTNNFSSFIGGNMDFGNMRNIFNERSSTPTGMSQQYNDSLEAKPIEVISMRPSKNESTSADFNISSFLKTVLPSSDGTQDPGGIPGLGLDIPDSQVGSPQRSNYRHSPVLGQHSVTPVISRMMGVNNCQISHSTPLPVRNMSGESHTPSPYSSQNSQSNITGLFDAPTNNNTVNPLPPPPLPPPIFLDDENCYNKLPPKFPTWTPPNETIKEPAKWEEKGKNSMNPTWPGECDEKSKAWMDGESDRWDPSNETTWINEYDDPPPQDSLLSTTGDVDHRVIPIPMTVENQLPYRLMKAADVDHRNLISLTGSPANHNVNDNSMSTIPNSSSLWSTGDQDYRRHMQPGDIVESVDMEMSDDETDSKPKGRVLVDVRSQDRDMRVGNPPPSQHMDMDMRMIPLPSGQMPGPHGSMMQDVHMMHSGPPPPPPPPPQFHPNQGSFHQDQGEFRHNPSSDFHPSQSGFHQNRPPPSFLQNQQDFGPQDFHQMRGQPDFPPQDFEYRENHNMRSNQEFLGESQMRGRYSQPDHPHRDMPFHRKDRGRGGGRGFSRNRRDRYSDDHNKPRNIQNNRKRSQDQHQRSSPEILPNCRPLLLQPPDTVVILDEEGMPIGIPDDKDNPSNTDHQPDQEQEESPQSHPPDRRSSHGTPNSRDHDQSTYSGGSSHVHEHEPDGPSSEPEDQQQVTVVPVAADSKDSQHSHYVPISEYEEHVESEPVISEKICEIGESPETVALEMISFAEQQQQHMEQLEDLVNESSNDLKRPSTNGGFDDPNDLNSSKKRLLLNGPQTPNVSDSSVNGPIPQAATVLDTHPGSGIYEFDGPLGPNFRPRLAGPVPFPPWRGGPPRGRGFRGGPRGAPWMDRGPRGPAIGTFVPRGMKRGGGGGSGQFRGNGFRGRGRGNNW